MIESLLGRGQLEPMHADVAIVGAGIAGLIMAARLADAGLKVAVLEAGARKQEGEEHALNEVVFKASVYHGASAGRFRCLGGTSTRWGGALLPFLGGDHDHRWPVGEAELAPYVKEAEAVFGLPNGSYEDEDLFRSTDGKALDYVARFAKWPAFKKRNVAVLLDEKISAVDGPRIWLDAVVTKFGLDDGGRLASVSAEATDGSSMTVFAGQLLIAAGAIESTRLLLLLDRQHDNRIFAATDALGRYFHDHLSVMVGNLETSQRKKLNRIAGFRFQGGGMRNLRFELRSDSVSRRDHPTGFAHIAFAGDSGGGFDTLRSIFRYLQQRRVPPVSLVLPLLREFPWLAQAIWWRLMERRLLYPSNADIQLHQVIEQDPDPANQITLSPDRVDSFGQPLAVIDWRVGAIDRANIRKATERFASEWQASTLASIGSIRLRPLSAIEDDLTNTSGIYHPGGTTRMSASSVDGVVDNQLRTFAVPNLRIVSTSTFPTGGGANPTMTLTMLALRTADDVVKQHRGARS